MRIMLDLDGVFFNFGESVKSYLDVKGLGHLWKSGPTSEPYWDWYADWGWSDEDFVNFCHEAADAGYLFTGPMREGAKEAWEALVETGHDIIVCTDRSFGSTPQVSHRLTMDWLEEHDLWFDELIFSADKTVSKCDLAIDDKISNIDALTAAGTKAYLLNRPWNKADDARNRVDSIQEFVDIVNRTTADGFYDLTLA